MGNALQSRLRSILARRGLSKERYRIARVEALERRIALTVTWAGGGDGVSWTDPANWSVGRVPGASDDVVLDVAGDLTVIYRGNPASVRSLANHETIWVQGSTATGPANLRTVTDLSNFGTIRLETISDDINDRGSYLTIGGILTNQPSGRVEANAGAGDRRVIAGTVRNQGLVTSSGIELPIVDVYIADGGTLGGNAFLWDAEVRVLTAPATPTNVRLRGWNNTITTDNLPGMTLWVEGSVNYGVARLNTAANVTNRGTIRLESTSNDVNDRSSHLLLGSSFVNAASGVIQANTGAGDWRVIYGTLRNQGLVTSDGIDLIIDDVYIADGGTLGGNAFLWDAEVRVLTAPATPTIVRLRGWNNTITTDNLPGMTLWVEGSVNYGVARLNTAANVTNRGTIRLESTSNDVNDRSSHLLLGTSFVNAASGVIQANTGAGDWRVIYGTLRNQGLVTSDGIDLSIVDVYIADGGTLAGNAFLHDAEIRVLTAPATPTTVRLRGYENWLTTDNLPGMTLWVEGTSTHWVARLRTAPNITNRGTIRLESTSNDVNDRSSHLELGAAFINAPSGVIQANTGAGDWRVIYGTLRNQGLVTSDGIDLSIVDVYIADGGTLAGNAFLHDAEIRVLTAPTPPTTVRLRGYENWLTTDNLPGMTLWVEGTSTHWVARLRTAPNITNRGTIRLESTSNDVNDRSSHLELGAAFVNAPSGVIQANTGAGDWRVIYGTLRNQGLVTSDGIDLLIDNVYVADGGTLAGNAFLYDAEVRVLTAPANPTTVRLRGFNNTLTTDNLPGMTLWVEGTNPYGAARLHTAANVSNRGTIRLETTSNDVNDRGSYLVPGTSFVNAAGGVIDARVGAGDARHILGAIMVEGSFVVEPNVTLNIDNTLTVNSFGSLTRAGMGPLRLANGLLGDTRNARQFADGASIVLWGGNSVAPKLLEAMSQDRGNVAAGFTDNFVIGSFSLEAGAFVRLVDQSNNDGAAGPEAVYVNSLVVPAGATLDLNGLRIFARASQIGGVVLNGVINEAFDGGPIALGTTATGRIAVMGEEDRWTFFGRAGQSILANLNTGNGFPQPLSPRLNFGEMRLIAPSGAVVASGFNIVSGNDVRLIGVVLPEDGTYTVAIRASANQPASTGRYSVGIFDSTVRTNPLAFNQRYVSTLSTPFSYDRWTFSAMAGQQIRLDLVNASNASIKFTLTGPGGSVVFSDLNTDSDLITLADAGSYELAVSPMGGFAGSYAFQVDETQQTPLQLGVPFSGTLTGRGHARIFRVDVPEGQTLSFELDGVSPLNTNELYARLGSPPTRSVFDYGSSAAGSDKTLLVPFGSAGTWYVLVYGENVPAPGGFTLVAKGSPVKLTESFPPRAGNAAPVMLTLSGAGFRPGTTVALIAADGTTTFAPSSIDIDRYDQITATFPAGLPAGGYSVRVTNGPSSDTLPSALQFTQGGVPALETRLIMPGALGRRALATLHVEYANTGDVAMPAPLLALQSADADNSDKPIFTMNRDRIIENFWSSGLPPETSHTALILASGRQPGVLNPGERIQVPVYYLGLLQPWNFSDMQVELEIRHWNVDDQEPMDWQNLQPVLRPATVSNEAWSAIFANLSSGLTTTGDYVRMLNQNAAYLGRLGRNVNAVDDLWNFEFQQAFGYSAISTLDSAVDATLPTTGLSLSFSRSYGNAIQSRYALGPLGRGWENPWLTQLTRSSGDNIVQVIGAAGAARSYQRDSRYGTYFSSTGDSSTLVNLGGGVFETKSVDGTVTRFRADGKIDHVRDTNGNRVTPGYDPLGRLNALTHSNGASLTFQYNAAGRIQSVTDTAGRVTTYGYDATNAYLTSVTTPDGKITRYTYETTGTIQKLHALKTIERGGVTQTFLYDDRGRLDGSWLTGFAQWVDFNYDETGIVTARNVSGTSSLYFDHKGLIAKTVDPLGNLTTNEYDSNFRLSRSVSPTGESQSFTWCNCGSMTSVTNELGQKTSFAYDNPYKRMTSFTDAKGNTTRYTYDTNGNLLETIYPDGSEERLGSYTATGLPQQYTNRRRQPMSYAYNAAGQVTRQTFADATFITFEYDARGNLTRTVDGTDITTYTYNYAVDGDRLRRVTYPSGRFLDYVYDNFGRRIRMTDQDGFATKYEYDAAGRLYRLRDSADTLLVTYLYDDAGRLSRTDKGNGTFTTYTYDAAGQLLSLKNWRNVTTLNSKFDYTYDSRGRRVSMATLEGTWTYAYDSTGQLIRAVFASLDTNVIPHQD